MTKHAAMQPLAEDGPGTRWWGYGRTPGAAVLGLASLTTDFVLWAAGWAWIIPMSVLGPNL